MVQFNNPMVFKRFGVNHLSPNHLDDFVTRNGMWIMKRGFGFEEDPNPTMTKGSAVGKEFLKRAYEAQAGESGDNMISDSIKNKYDIADFFPMSRDLAPQFTTADIPYTQRFPNIFSDPEISKRLDEVGFFERDMVPPKEPNTFVGGNKMLENYAIEDDGIVSGLQKSDVDEFDPYLSPSFPFYDDNRQKYMNYLLQSGAYD